ncbi:MAG: alpha-2-macroglobulin family protein [Promethearchaeota archaeon]
MEFLGGDKVDGLENPQLRDKVKETREHFPSEDFYRDLYSGWNQSIAYKPFPEVEANLTRMNRRPDGLQRSCYVSEVLSDWEEHLVPPLPDWKGGEGRTSGEGGTGPSEVIRTVLYHHAYLERLLGLVDWERVSSDVREQGSKLREAIEGEVYLRKVLERLLDSRFLRDLFTVEPAAFPAALDEWAAKVREWAGKPTREWVGELGDFPPGVELDPVELFEGLFGRDLGRAKAAYYGFLGDRFAFLLKKGEYWWGKPDHEATCEYLEGAEAYYDKLSEVAGGGHQWSGVVAEKLALVDSEHLFDVFHAAVLNHFKNEIPQVGEMQGFLKALDILDPDGGVELPHLARETREMLYFQACLNFLFQIDTFHLFSRRGSSIQGDFARFRDLLGRCVDVVEGRRDLVGEGDWSELVSTARATDNFEFFWSHYSFENFAGSVEVVRRSLAEMGGRGGDPTPGGRVGAKTEEDVYRASLDYFSDRIAAKPLLGTIWDRTPTRLGAFRETWQGLLRDFRESPYAPRFGTSLDMLEYHFRVAEEKVAAYYEDLKDTLAGKRVVFACPWDEMHAGHGDEVVEFPLVVGYPKYTSIMTDVGGPGDTTGAEEEEGEPPSFEPTPGGPGKVHTTRERFEDVGFYEIVPGFRDGELRLEVALPDSITTQELHVAAFDQRCDMAYEVKEVRVKQELFIQDDLPARLTWNDEIEVTVTVTNASSEHLGVAVTLHQEYQTGPMLGIQGDHLGVSFTSPQKLDMPPGSIRAVKLALAAENCGTYLLKIVADSEKFTDEVHKTLRVGAGFPSDVEQTFEFLRPTSAGESVEKRFVLKTPEDAVDFAHSLSVYPSLTSHLLDGIEANMKYPYGYVEQVFSALMPNLVYYDYLAGVGLFSGDTRDREARELKDRLERNIVAGYLKLQANQQQNGGFGWWSSSHPSPLLTAMVLPAYALLHKHHFLVETHSVEQSVDFLLEDTMDADVLGWKVPRGEGPGGGDWMLSRFTDLTLTVHVLRGLVAARDAGLLNGGQEYLVDRCLERLSGAYRSGATSDATDCHMLCQILELLEVRDPESARAVAEKILKFRAGKFWFKGSATGTDVETTALVARVLWTSGKISETTLNEVLDWVYTQKDPRGGWPTTSDTRAVVELLAALLDGEKCDLSLEVVLDGTPVVERTRVTAANLTRASYELSHLPLARLLAGSQPGDDHELIVSVRGTGAPAFKLVRETWVEKSAQPLAGLQVGRECEKTEARVFDEVEVVLKVRVPPELDEMVVVEEPLLPGASVVQSSLDELVRRGVVVGHQYSAGKVAFFLPSGAPERTLRYAFRGTRKFSGTQPPPSAYPMYAPHEVVTGNPTAFKFTRGTE